MICMKKLVFFGAGITGALLIAMGVPVNAQLSPVPRNGGGCPAPWNISGNFCVPSPNSTTIFPRNGGGCPAPYNISGNFCVAPRR